jgi:ribosome modulation factor
MSDKIVYLVNKVTARMLDTNLQWVDDEMLSAIMSEGYEQVSAMDRKVAGVKATMIVLRPSGENRGMVRARPPEEDQIDVPDGFGTRSVSIGQAFAGMQRDLTVALQNMGDSGHLGGARNHSMPGMTIVSGELVGKAYDAGQIAANRGMGSSACPFPPGSAPYTKWMQGFKAAGATPGAVSENAQREAYSDGMGTARSLGRDDAVHCPYPRGSPLREHWLNGFKAGGGRVV